MFIIDGHNLIGSGRVPGVHLSQEDDEWRLVQWLRARRQKVSRSMVVIFDGGIPGGTSMQLSGGGVKVVFAASHREKADALILRRVRQQQRPDRITVVSDDTGVRQAAEGAGVQVMRCVEFTQMLANRQRRRRSPTRQRPAPEPKLPRAEVDAWLALFTETERYDSPQDPSDESSK